MPIPMKRYRAHIPAEAARHGEDIDIETRAVDELDMRHALRCWFGRIAADEAIVTEVPLPAAGATPVEQPTR
jgi:hypothetical protein